mgnify:CR=1 FL=1|tara:strand:- start:430 stop:780 length:351 start_codon:yes stop_codon:yes gene_type:complete
MINLYKDFQIKQNHTNEIIETDFSGVLRLQGHTDYLPYFSKIYHLIQSEDKHHVINLSELKFLNSNGLIALGQCFIYARDYNRSLTIIVNNNIPWQTKSISALHKLWDKVTIQLTK